jgi:hypothetical protein
MVDSLHVRASIAKGAWWREIDLRYGPTPEAPLPGPVGETAPRPALRFKVDTFAFRNDSRVHHRGKPDLYANWCFVLARAVTQFQRFARFDPALPRLSPGAYRGLVARVIAYRPWRPPLPASTRVPIPGYASLYEFTRGEEAAVKAGLGGRFWTLVHPTNWRIAFPSRRSAQFRVAVRTVEELRAGRPVQFIISDFPKIRLNHSVLAYDYRITSEDSLEFVVYDPNGPHTPGVVSFDRRTVRFRPTPLIGVSVPYFRAFRMYHSPVF